MAALDASRDYETILETIRRWPLDRRFALLQDIINAMAVEVTHPGPTRQTLGRALGLLATDRPAPSDAEIEEWLNERRMEKYG